MWSHKKMHKNITDIKYRQFADFKDSRNYINMGGRVR